MSRNWIGGAGNPPATSNTCMVVFIMLIVYSILWIILYSVMTSTANCSQVKTYDPYARCSTDKAMSALMSYLLYVLNLAFLVYIIISMCQTRRTIRDKYNIPPSCCEGCDDCCCSFWCSCCTVNQMARHTNDYRAYPIECCSGECFNKTGQPAGAPVIVV